MLSTAAGAGMKSTNKDMMVVWLFWGVARIYQYGVSVAAVIGTASVKRKREKLYSNIRNCKENQKPFGQCETGDQNQGNVYGYAFHAEDNANPRMLHIGRKRAGLVKKDRKIKETFHGYISIAIILKKTHKFGTYNFEKTYIYRK